MQSPYTPLTPLSPYSSERHKCLIKYALLNTCYIRNMIPLILELAAEHDLYLILITETWITSGDILIISSLNIVPSIFLICLDKIPIIMEEVLTLSIHPPFAYLFYFTIIMITMMCLPVQLVPHTPRISIFSILQTPSS